MLSPSPTGIPTVILTGWYFWPALSFPVEIPVRTPVGEADNIEIPTSTKTTDGPPMGFVMYCHQ